MLDRMMGANGIGQQVAQQVAQRLDAIVSELVEINKSINAQTPTDPYQELVLAAWDSTNPIWIYYEQMRLRAAVFYTDTAGAYVFKLGNDTRWIFRALANMPVPIINGMDQETVVTAGLAVTVTGPASIWSIQTWGVPGNPIGAQNAR